jgi:hypothetical protein
MHPFASCACANAVCSSGATTGADANPITEANANPITEANANPITNPWAKSQFAGRWLLFMGWR